MTSWGYLKLALLQLLAAAAPMILYALFVWLASVRSQSALLATSPTVFPALALVAGFVGGYQFPLASRLYFASSDEPRTGKPEVRASGFSELSRSEAGSTERSNPGILYGLDLVGACLGAVALSAYLLPVYGFLRTAILMAGVNLGPAALAGWGAFEASIRQTKGPLDKVHQKPAP